MGLAFLSVIARERVAQLVEHRTFNPVVAGSSPAPFTISLLPQRARPESPEYPGSAFTYAIIVWIREWTLACTGKLRGPIVNFPGEVDIDQAANRRVLRQIQAIAPGISVFYAFILGMWLFFSRALLLLVAVSSEAAGHLRTPIDVALAATAGLSLYGFYTKWLNARFSRAVAMDVSKYPSVRTRSSRR